MTRHQRPPEKMSFFTQKFAMAVPNVCNWGFKRLRPRAQTLWCKRVFLSLKSKRASKDIYEHLNCQRSTTAQKGYTKAYFSETTFPSMPVGKSSFFLSPCSLPGYIWWANIDSILMIDVVKEVISCASRFSIASHHSPHFCFNSFPNSADFRNFVHMNCNFWRLFSHG